MTIPSLFDICIPREDVQKGTITESDFAADLSQVLRGDAPEEYRNPARFFANTHPTRGLKLGFRLRKHTIPREAASRGIIQRS